MAVDEKRSSMRRWFGIGARAAVAAGLLGGMVWAADFSETSVVLDLGTIAGIVAGCLVLAITLHLSAMRWKVVLGSGPPGVRDLSLLYFIGWFFSQFLPSSVGGDAARLVGLRRAGIGYGRGGSSILLERLLGLAALFVLLGIGVATFPSLAFRTAEGSSFGIPMSWVLLAGGAVLVGVTLAGTLLWRHERFQALLRNMIRLWQEFLSSRPRLAQAGVLSVLVQLGWIAVWVVLAFALRLEIPLLVHLFFVPAVSLATLLPITVSGLGVREGFTVLILAPFGVTVADAVAYGLLFYLTSVIVGVIGGAVFLKSGLSVAEVTDVNEKSNVSKELVTSGK